MIGEREREGMAKLCVLSTIYAYGAKKDFEQQIRNQLFFSCTIDFRAIVDEWARTRETALWTSSKALSIASWAQKEKKFKIDKNWAEEVWLMCWQCKHDPCNDNEKSFAACFIKPRCNLNSKHQLNKCKHTWNNDNIFIKSSLRSAQLYEKKGFSIKSLHDGI